MTDRTPPDPSPAVAQANTFGVGVGVTAVAVAGKVEQVDYPKGTATLLLFFLSSCPHCHQMLPRWSEAYTKRPKGVRAYGIILDQEFPGFFTAMPVTFPVLRTPSQRVATE